VVTAPERLVDDLRDRWRGLLPAHADLGEDLLRRWTEPGRSYHGPDHLAGSLAALASLGGDSRAERLALWFHDAVHTGTPAADEHASAELAGLRLAAAGLAADEVAEVQRLVLVTLDHSPAPDDAAGARVSDADLAILAAEPAAYLASVAALRAEVGDLDDLVWRQARRLRLAALLDGRPIFHTPLGRDRWEVTARANLAAELAGLTSKDEDWPMGRRPFDRLRDRSDAG
jgi:predicted metal-dependent HD superfamily phosphohydrolase